MTLSPFLLVLSVLGGPQTPEPDPPGKGPATESMVELTELVCLDCHRGGEAAGGVDLGAALAAPMEHLGLLTRAHGQVRQGFMPPADAPGGGFDEDEQREWTAGVLEFVAAAAHGPAVAVAPGPTLRRLTRTQIQRSLDALFQDPIQVARFLPRDASSYGFDTTGDTLFVTPLGFEAWSEAVDALVLGAGNDEPILVELMAMGTMPKEERDEALGQWIERFFGRPPTALELSARGDILHGEGDTAPSEPTAWARDVLRATLLSPGFLYRAEVAGTGDPGDLEVGSPRVRPITGTEFAERMSFFLWGSLPDAALLDAARRGELESPEARRRAFERMCEDPRARSLAEDFGSQWLGISELQDVTPDVRRFKGFNEGLRRSMKGEAVAFFADLLEENRSVLECLDSDHAFLDRRLAKHYAIDGIKHGDIRRVPITDPLRGGVLGMAGVLTVTSYPLRTSPVKRGQWVLGRLFGAVAPPPPPNAGTLPEDDQQGDGLSLRARLEHHRRSPECASCHRQMDPYGLALEAFDGIGATRATSREAKLDTGVVLPNGQPVAGPTELKAALLEDSDRFVETLGSALFTYAVGRAPTLLDLVEIQGAARACGADGHRFKTLLRGIAGVTAMTHVRINP